MNTLENETFSSQTYFTTFKTEGSVEKDECRSKGITMFYPKEAIHQRKPLDYNYNVTG